MDGWLCLGVGVVYGRMGILRVSVCVCVFGVVLLGVLARFQLQRIFLGFNWLEWVMCAEGGKEMDSGVLAVFEAV